MEEAPTENKLREDDFDALQGMHQHEGVLSGMKRGRGGPGKI